MTKFHVSRIKGGIWCDSEEDNIQEVPMTIYLNTREWLTKMCQANELKAFTIGCLYDAYLITSYDDIVSLIIDEDKSLVYVELKEDIRFDPKRYITSGCAVSAVYPFVEDAVRLRFKTLDKSLVKLQQVRTSIDRIKTGHQMQAAMVFDNKSKVTCDICIDHAVDKSIGFLLMNNLTPDGVILSLNGLVSTAILLKAIRVGISKLVTTDRVTSNAIELAKMYDIVLVSFRDDCVNVYSGKERIVLDQSC